MQLSKLFMQIVFLISIGMKNKEIGLALGKTQEVIKNHIRIIYDELGFSNRVELAMWYIKNVEGTKHDARESIRSLNQSGNNGKNAI